jgi:protein involved in temperature-dependent protein secretion
MYQGIGSAGDVDDRLASTDSHLNYPGTLAITYTHPNTDDQQAFVRFEVSGFVGRLVDWAEISDIRLPPLGLVASGAYCWLRSCR